MYNVNKPVQKVKKKKTCHSAVTIRPVQIWKKKRERSILKCLLFVVTFYFAHSRQGHFVQQKKKSVHKNIYSKYNSVQQCYAKCDSVI